MSDQTPEASLGEAVRAAREAAGMTVFQVSARTRIRPEILQDLEQGRTASSGGAVYARGHLKSIAAATGADPAVLLAAHDTATGSTPVVAAAAPEPMASGSVPISSLRLPSSAVRERSGPRWGLAAAATAAVVVLFLAVGTWSGRTHDAPSTAAPGPAATSSAPPAAPAAPAPTVGPSAVASVPAPSGAALRLRVTGRRSWVSVTGSGGKNLFRGVVDRGAVKDFSDPSSLTVTVGDAGAVSLICGGKDARAGAPGQVRTFTCKRSGLVPA